MRPGLLVCLLLLALPVAAAEPAEISFEKEAVVASGLTAKGKAVWFSLAREISRNATTIVPRIEIRSDDDGDGEVRLELDREVPRKSIWFAVDLTTGEMAVATPGSFPRIDKDLPARAIPAALNRLELDRQFAYVVVIRPGVGA